MVTIQNAEELIAVWNRVFQADDPVKSLETQGVLLTSGLKQKVFAPDSQANRLSDAQRSSLLKRLKALRRDNISNEVNFSVRPSLPFSIAKDLPPGEYDLILGIKLDLVNQTLAGLFETHTWPNLVKSKEAGKLFKLDELRAFSADVPTVDGVEVGALHFPAPPTASFGDRDSLFVSQSFTLDIDLVQSSIPQRRTISTLVGTLRWNLQMNAEQDGADPQRLRVNFVNQFPDPASDRLEIGPGSPIQPRSAAALRLLKDAVSLRIIGLLIRQSFSICPVFTLPLGEGVPLRVQRADVRATPTFDDVGALMVGILIGTTPTPDPNSGSTNQLQNAPFASGITNVYLRFHEALANKLAKVALDAGVLESKTPDLPGNLTVKLDSISVDFKAPNKLGVKARARFEDFCGPGPFNFKDLHFDITGDLQLVPGLNGQVNIVPGDIDINFDNSDQAVCAISGLVDLATVVFAVDTVGELIVVAVAKLIGPDRLTDKLAFQFQAIFDPKENIPFTEMVPRGEVVQAAVRANALEALGSLTLRPDDRHAFLYLSVCSRLLVVGPSRPVAGAAVQVMDQDAPAPADDDAVPPQSTTTVQGSTITKVTVSVKRPIRNELLAEGSTDDDGRLFLVIDRLSTAGTIITKTISENTAEDSGVKITTKESPLQETRPDIFFRVKLPGEEKARDTRPSGEGLFFQPNLNSRRLGEPNAPLTLIFGRIVQDETEGNIAGITS